MGQQVLVVLGDELGTVLSIRWQSAGPMATGYVVELRESTSTSIDRFVQDASATTTGILELQVRGRVPGSCYAACVRSLAQCGCESAPSAWSDWFTLPVPAPADAPVSPHSMLLKTQGQLPLEPNLAAKHCEKAEKILPPEVTGHEKDMLLLD